MEDAIVQWQAAGEDVYTKVLMDRYVPTLMDGQRGSEGEGEYD